MPENYKYKADYDAEILAQFWHITAPARDA